MKFAHTIAAASMAGAALGLVPVTAASAGTAGQPAASQSAAGQPTAGQAAGAARVRPVFINCDRSRITRPKSLVWACGDGSETLGSLHWSSWRPGQATARGLDWLNDCTPDCVHGTWHKYPIRLGLSGSRRVAGHPAERSYGRYTITYTGQSPTAQKTRTGLLWP